MAAETVNQAEGDDRRRRRLIIVILIVLAVVLLLLLLSICANGEDEAAPETTTTSSSTVAAAPTTTTTAAPTTTTTTSPPTTTTAAVTTTTVPPTIEGVWSVTVDVTLATRVCRGEEKEKPYHRVVTITLDGDRFTAVGLGNPRDEQVWEGMIEGDVITFGGSRREDDGVTTAMFTMTVDPQRMTMIGREDWTWKGPGGSCPGSESEVTAARLSP